MKLVRLSALAVFGFVACAPGSASTGKVIEVRIEHSAFQPAVLEVPAGTRVTFVIRNDDPIDHEFILGNEEVQLIHEKGTEAHHGAKPGEVTVPAGETRSTTYTFGRPQDLLVGCHLPGHYDYGMRGAVEVR